MSHVDTTERLLQQIRDIVVDHKENEEVRLAAQTSYEEWKELLLKVYPKQIRIRKAMRELEGVLYDSSS